MASLSYSVVIYERGREVITMLANYIISHEKQWEEMLLRHPVLGLVTGMFLTAAGILLAVSGVACLLALPVCLITGLL